MDLWIGSGRLAFNHHQRTETAVCQSGHLWEQPAIDERREQIRMGLSLDEDPVRARPCHLRFARPRFRRPTRGRAPDALGRRAPAQGRLDDIPYDFGDSWTHRVVLETVEEADAARSAVIVAGKGACPPEDCGGVGGYARVVSAALDPDHPEHHEVREWLGGEFDPAAFDLAAINRALRRVSLRDLQLRAPRRRSPIERVLAGPEEPSPTFRAKLKTKLEDPAAILTDREVRYLASQVELALAAVPQPTRAAVPSAEDIVRWSAVAARCRQVREERGWTTKDAASALKVARYKIDAVEKGPVRDYELEVAVRYFRLLGLEAWIARWTRSNSDLARRQGLGM